MASPILPKHNNTAGTVPAAASLATNELAINTADAVAYVKHSDGTVKQIVDPTKAPLASPALTGTPTAPTATAGTSTTQLATTAFVTNANKLVQSAGYLSMSLVSNGGGGTCSGLFNNTQPGYSSICQIKDSTDAPTLGWWMVETIRYSDPNYPGGTQVARGWDANAGKIFERNNDGGSWSVWRKVVSAKNSGNVLLGTDTDNGVDKLQVNGSISTTTATPGTSNNQVATTAFVTTADNLKANNADLLQAIGNINSPLLDLPLKNSLAMKLGVGNVTFTRSSTATYIDRYGMLQVAGVDTPRFEKQGYLNEGSSTNLLTYSEQFDNSVWGQTNATVSANTTATLDPYGTNLADKIVEDSSTNLHYISQTLTVSSSTLTFSCFVKAAESTKFRLNSYESSTPSSPIVADFDLSAVTATPGNTSTISSTITPLANGWFRVSATTTTAAKVSTSFYLQTTRLGTGAYAGDGSSGVYVFGAQLETWSFTTSYIPTVASAVTRTADILNFTQAGNIPNIGVNGAISVLCDIDVFGDYGGNQWAWAMYPSGTDHIGLVFMTTGGYSSIASNVADISASFNAALPRTRYRVAQVASNAGHYVYENGIQVGFAANTHNILTSTCNSSCSTVRIGSYTSTDTVYHTFNGHISNFRVYDRALTAYEALLA
jgi:hypothetical protein